MAERAASPLELFSADDVAALRAAAPAIAHPIDATDATFTRDLAAAQTFLARAAALRARLPARPQRSAAEHAAFDALTTEARDVRTRLMRTYVSRIYRALTGDLRAFLRLEALLRAAAERFPHLVPTQAEVDAELQRPLSQKDGDEMDQATFLAYVFNERLCGQHFLHACRLPLPEALERRAAFERDGVADLGHVFLERRDGGGMSEWRNVGNLNSEDVSTLHAVEIAIDLVLLDPSIVTGVMRGGVIERGKYAGKRVFSAGLNLTHLYYGRLPYHFYVTREVSPLSKVQRGHAPAEFYADEPERQTEKPFIGVVESFAIGGGCQWLLVLDYVIAAQGTFFNLPARKEGIIPGVANLRLTRFTGERISREAIFFDRAFPADSPDGKLLCDEVVPESEVDAAIDRVVESLGRAGTASLTGNRRTLRVSIEPQEDFQRYCAVFARDMADCLYSPALIRNLEENWDAKQRRLVV